MSDYLTASSLGDIPHGFSSSAGLGADQILPGAALVRVRQVHSATVVTACDAWEEPPEADAIVTNRPALALGIVTADCAPVLLADPEARVIGAAHAGWRGASAGVLGNTVAAMETLGASRGAIRAAIGPTIAQASYEVDAAFRDHFTHADARFFTPGRAGHWQFDLPAYAAQRLREAGVTRIDDVRQDTYTQPERFHSYRRAGHRGEETAGRQLSIIALGR